MTFQFINDILWMRIVFDVIDIAAVAFLIYQLYKFISGTRAIQVMVGFIVMLVVYLVVQLFQLRLMTAILQFIIPILPIVLVIIFQPELRRVLLRLGTIQSLRKLFRGISTESTNEIVSAVKVLAERKIGALIVLRRNDLLGSIIETGIKIDSEINTNLLLSIFNKHAPLHDGAVVIENDRIVSASCVLPLTTDASLPKKYGTRHRAAVGLSEESDAVIIIVSEESGTISVANKGKLNSDYSVNDLRKSIKRMMRVS